MTTLGTLRKAPQSASDSCIVGIDAYPMAKPEKTWNDAIYSAVKRRG